MLIRTYTFSICVCACKNELAACVSCYNIARFTSHDSSRKNAWKKNGDAEILYFDTTSKSNLHSDTM